MRVLRRVGVLGDVHGEPEALEAALVFFREAKTDAVLCVGDVVDWHGDVSRCPELLRKNEVMVVRGNHERWCLANEMRNLPFATLKLSDADRAYIETWPKSRRFQTPMGGLLLCHGVGEDDMAELRPSTRGYGLLEIAPLRGLMLDPEISFMVGGHTHVHMVRRFQGLVAINAGTLAQEHDPCVALLDFEAKHCAFHSARVGQPMDVLDEGELPYPAELPAVA
jgi:predicted phosphodiesterase